MDALDELLRSRGAEDIEHPEELSTPTFDTFLPASGSGPCPRA